MSAVDFTPWLQLLASSKKGPVTLYASRGRKFEATISLPGDFTGSTLRGEVRKYPDAPGAPLVTFAITGPTVGAETTTFGLSLDEGSGVDSTGFLPPDVGGSGLARFAYDILITPSGDDEQLLFGGVLQVAGRVTA